jgi:hypothetical protein
MSDEWKPIETAPKDGSEFLAYGYNWGLETRGRHRHVAKWLDDHWVAADDEDLTLQYLRGWMPLRTEPLPSPPSQEGTT